MKNSNLILGISDSVDCGATLAKNNEILCAINEERFNRKKFCYGFPKESILRALKIGKVKSKNIKVIAVAGVSRMTKNFTPYNNLLHYNKKKTSDFVWKIASWMSFFSNNFVFKVFFRSSFFLFFLRNIYYKPFLFLRKKNILDNLKKIDINPEQIFFYDHHLIFELVLEKNSLIISIKPFVCIY